MKAKARFWVLLAAGLGVVGGCGGGNQPAGVNPAGGAVVNSPPPNAAPLPGPQQPATARNAAPPAATVPGLADDADESALPGPDDFELSADQTVLELAGTFSELPPTSVEVVAIEPGLNSSTLIIVGAVNGTEPAAVNLAPPVNPVVNPAPTKPAAKANSKSSGANTKSAPEPTAAGWQLPAGAEPVAGSGLDPETGLPLKIKLELDAVEMVLIPPGVFQEGVDDRDPQAGPQHSVLLETPYYIDIVEVTVARYDAFREFLRKTEGRRMDPPVNHDTDPQMPAVGLKFLDAKFYAKWTGKELPTEAQWERAARGNQGFQYPWGNGRPIWHRPRRPGQLDSVATYLGDISPYGVYDLAGNAREWCLDLYLADIYQKDVAAGGNTVRNPTGPKTIQGPKIQAVRGGKTDWSVWQRSGQPQAETAPDLGFRCVLNVLAASKELGKPTPKGGEKKKKMEAF